MAEGLEGDKGASQQQEVHAALGDLLFENAAALDDEALGKKQKACAPLKKKSAFERDVAKKHYHKASRRLNP